MILRANWIELVTGELVGVRVVAGDEIDPLVHERGTLRESRSNDQLGALALALRQLEAGGMPALSTSVELANQLPGAAVEVIAHGAIAYSGASSKIEMEQ